MNLRYLYFAAFSSGMVTLAVELTSARLLGAHFGTTNLMWASIIGLILIYLSVGYYFGGRYADRWPHPGRFYGMMLLGGFAVGVVPLVAQPVLRAASNAFDQLQMGFLLGSFVSILVLMIVPIILLGAVSPFALKLAFDKAENAGQLAGRMSAIGTMGSFVGTFLPDLILIPLLGTARTFLALSMYLMVVALLGFIQVRSARKILPWTALPLLMVGVFVYVGTQPIKDTEGLVFETESSYNYIQVLEQDGYTLLRLNEGQGIHSIYHPTDLDYDGPWEQFLVGPFFNPAPVALQDVERIAVVGLAAGTVARQATQVFGAVPIDGYEIDAEIIEVGRQFFGMTMPNLNAVAQDGRWGLRSSQEIYSLIAIDAYRPPYIPWHLTTREFFQLTSDRLAEDGVLVINVGRAPEDRRLIDVLVTTLATVYPSVHVMDIPNTFNSMVYATKQPTSFENLATNLNLLATEGDVDPLLLDAILNVLTYRQPTPEPTLVLTDDHAPVEWIINSMVLRFIFSGDYQELQ